MPDVRTSLSAILVREDGIQENRLIVVRLRGVLADTEGALLTTAWTTHFSTHFDPLYAPANRIRAEIGRFIADIPDDTINQLSWKWSLRADILRRRGLVTDNVYGTGAEDADLTLMIKADYVTAKTCLSLLTASPEDAGYSKSLADLRVSRQQGALRNAIEWYESQVAKLEAALMQGGFLGIRPQATVMGLMDPDRPSWGREWAKGSVPAANTRMYSPSGRNTYKTFRRGAGRLF